MRRIAAFLLLAGLSQIPLWAGDYFMPGRSLYPTYHETPPPAPVVVSEVRVEPLAPVPTLTPAKAVKPAPKKTTPKSEPVAVKPAATVGVAEAVVVVPASGTAPVVTPVYGKTVGVELLPPTGMGRAVSATPPAGTPLVSVTAEKPAAVRGARPATVASATTEAIVPVPVPIPGMVATRTEYALPNAPFAAPASVVSIQAVHEMQSASPVKATKKGSAKAPTETLVPVAVTLPGTTITRTEYVAVKTPFAAPASVPVIPVAAAAPATPLARVFAPTRPVVPVQYIAPAPTPVPTGAAPAAAPVYTGGECPSCGRSGSCDSGGMFSGRLRSWFLFQPTTRNALPRLQPTPYTGPVLAWRCDGNCPPGSYWGGCNTPGHCSGAGCGAAGGCATGTCASGTCGGARAAVAGATCGLGGRLGLGLGGSCKTGCTPADDDAIAGHRFANGGTQPVWGTAPVAGPVTTTSYKPAAARTMDAPSQFYKPSYGTDAAPAAGVAPTGGNVLARPFTRP
ncbi:unnamed protein product [Gemmataceae bacterium]|nr:unnamed protein product [Gemmataceae bacterium]VTT99982.1 unnamed protein product [Gemmataceae bacterium]